MAKKAESRVCTYLFDVNYDDVKDPFSQFQHTIATEVDTKKLIATINRAMPDGASLAVGRLEKAFEMWWPQLRDRLAGIPEPSAQVDSERTDSDKISEILTRVRALESVIVTREISAVSEAAATLHADIDAKLRRLNEREGYLISRNMTGPASPFNGAQSFETPTPWVARTTLGQHPGAEVPPPYPRREQD